MINNKPPLGYLFIYFKNKIVIDSSKARKNWTITTSYHKNVSSKATRMAHDGSRSTESTAVNPSRTMFDRRNYLTGAALQQSTPCDFKFTK